MFTTVLKGFISLAVSTLGSIALAAPIPESGDAGDLPAAAQILGDVGSISSISGRIESSRDVDMFQLSLASAATLSFLVSAASTIDSQLFLFNSAGAGLWANDDMGTSLDAQLTVPLASGDYYLAVGSWDRHPLEGTNLPIFGSTGGMLLPPLNPGIVTAWGGSGGIGDYTINVAMAPIPEPGTWLLTSAGVFALLGRRRLQRRSARGNGEPAK
ncbi:MAG: DVUA0089 family protein [Telluria sp.]